MRFIPDYTLNILSDSAFSEEIKNITAKLDSCRHSGYFDSFDGKALYYEYFLAENSTASIVLVHGLSEFTKKYYELAYYFLNQGYNVFLYDQRSHGLSFRMAEPIDLIHVDSFEDYVKDLALFIDNVVIPADSKPLFIYSHSMGGGVSALYLARHPEKIQKAVLSAPLFDPQIGNLNHTFALWGTRFYKLLRTGRAKFMFSKEFDPDIPFEKSKDVSRARFEHNMGMRRADPHYQSTPMSLGWICAALTFRKKLLKKRITGRIQTPILLLSAENDTMVKNDAQHQFAGLCATCQLVTLKNTNHSMLTSRPEIIEEHIKRTLDFYRG